MNTVERGRDDISPSIWQRGKRTHCSHNATTSVCHSESPVDVLLQSEKFGYTIIYSLQMKMKRSNQYVHTCMHVLYGTCDVVMMQNDVCTTSSVVDLHATKCEFMCKSGC